MDICDALVVNKMERTLEVLQVQYLNADIIFLQEVGFVFMEELLNSTTIAARFQLLQPASVDYTRDQNSAILVSKSRIGGVVSEIPLHFTPDQGVPVADGDICAFEVPLQFDSRKEPLCFVLASFHGDTAGLASTPVVNAIRKAAGVGGRSVILGLDANTHKGVDSTGKTKHVQAFLSDCSLGSSPLDHCWRNIPESDWNTTCNARTYLQPQLNKAVPYASRHTSKLSDCHPKDFVLFTRDVIECVALPKKDNTGELRFIENIDFPTLTFPSDHAVVSTILRLRP